ncbi:MAG TPA: hypothetical protein VK130_07630 [Steroidobacteraceae bacterium]|nr:hypothetical protein [Steroidobacteraceae bacterium]
MTSFQGWTWEYIDEHMTIQRLLAINAYQEKSPPMHLMVAAYLGIKQKGSAPASNLIADLATMPGGMELPVHPRPIRRDLMPWLKKTST